MAVNPLFNAMGGSGMNLPQMIQQLKSNPMAVLGKRFNLPQNITSPNDIIQHLVQTGQVTQESVNAAYQQAQKMGLK